MYPAWTGPENSGLFPAWTRWIVVTTPSGAVLLLQIRALAKQPNIKATVIK